MFSKYMKVDKFSVVLVNLISNLLEQEINKMTTNSGTINITELNKVISNEVAKKFDDVIENANSILNNLRGALNFTDIIEATCKKYDDLIIKANTLIMEFNIASKISSQNTLELPVISTLKESIEKHNKVFSVVKNHFDKYMEKIAEMPKAIEDFNEESENVKDATLKEINNNIISSVKIKDNLDELDSKFFDLYTYYNYNILGSTNQKIHETDEMPEGSLSGIYPVITEKIVEAIKDINKCLSNVLQDSTYKSILNDAKVFSESTATPPNKQSSNLVNAELTDKFESLSVDGTQENTVASIHS